ncbi:MAG: acetylxylan esterase [Armatimonadetes bacterium]|nr:acetylxylan esterase [Armatimonadota bacterium]
MDFQMDALSDLATALRNLDAAVLPPDRREQMAGMLARYVQAKQEAASRQSTAAWRQARFLADWESLCSERIERLRRSLGRFPALPRPVPFRLFNTLEGEGFAVENFTFEGFPGVSIPANLYRPLSPRGKGPAFILIHSHHRPKEQGELQDMSMTWARAGCTVLVPELIGHGERGWHRPGPRQEYRFRHIAGIQLALIGDSLMGWMALEVARAVDFLLGRPQVDPERIILIGSVAGGGDVAAVGAALDSRISGIVPFNFGGPQPESPYPLPDDAEDSFDYMGSGSWESTRCLARSGSEGFLPWVIVGSLAPRALVYAHEFSWDRERDPVWPRLQQIYNLYGAGDHLDYTHGAGVLTGQPPEATHCTNVGPVHRERIHAAMERWFSIPIPEEYSRRMPEEALRCLPPVGSGPVRPLYEFWAETADARISEAGHHLAGSKPEAMRQSLRRAWTGLLGDIEPGRVPAVRQREPFLQDGFSGLRVLLEPEPGIEIPLLLLLPSRSGTDRLPVVIGLSQGGKASLLRSQADAAAALLESGVALCLPDVRGTGETAPGGTRSWQGADTDIAATGLMLGRTMLGARLRDVRSVIRWLETLEEIESDRLALWGDSPAEPNPPGLTDPLIGEGETPRYAEPLGGLLAVLGALYEESVQAVSASGLMAGYRSALDEAYCYLPLDCIVPGALAAGDLGPAIASLFPRPVRIERPVDGRNIPASDVVADRFLAPAHQVYAVLPERLALSDDPENCAGWLVRTLKRESSQNGV